MIDIHKRVTRRINNFRWNNKSSDHVAAEIIQMAQQEERVAVVAWIRRVAGEQEQVGYWSSLHELAENVGRGQHRDRDRSP